MADESTPQSAARRFTVMAAKAAVSVALLWFLLSRVDTAELWAGARQASFAWLLLALGIYTLNIIASTWRWHLLLQAQHVDVPIRALFGSLLVAGFFNNFLPSNIGGDVIRIRDTAPAAGSKTLATTIVLVDRGLGLMALVLLAAVGATMASQLHGSGASPIWPSWLWGMFLLGAAITGPAIYAPAGVERALQPLKIIHAEWVERRIDTMVEALGRFKARPSAIFGCFTGAIIVQGLVVFFYIAVAEALHIPVHSWDLAVIVPLSLVVQMLPVSVNGFGVREATFSLYFTRVGLPIASGVLLSLVAAAVMMFFSLSGAAVYVARGR
jgi:uncharacterized membrane protein YbhN (UPF0104 family)